MRRRSHPGGAAVDALRTDSRGETLIELLVTIVIISIGAVAMVSMMTSSVIAADAHRSLSEGEVVLRDFGEAIEDRAANLAVAGEWPECPTQAQLTPTYSQPGWTTELTGVRYWLPGAGSGTFTSARSQCTARYDALCVDDLDTAACDPGFVEVAYQVRNNRTGAAQTQWQAVLHVRRNNAP